MAPPKDDEQDWMPEGVAGDDSWMPEGIEGEQAQTSESLAVQSDTETAQDDQPQPNYYPVQMLPEPSWLDRFSEWVGNNGKAAMAGAVNYGLFGLGDEISASRSELLNPRASQSPSGQWQIPNGDPRWEMYDRYVRGEGASAEDVYRAERDKYRATESALREESPYWYHGVGLPIGFLSPAPQARTALGPVVNSALSGAMSGALGAAGNSEADLTRGEVGGFVSDTAAGSGTGAVVGGTLGWAGEKIPRVASNVRDWLAEKAEEKAVKSVTGRNQRVWESMINKDTLHDIGRDILDERLLEPSRWWWPFTSVETIRQRASGVAEEAGKDIGNTLKEIDALVPEEAIPWKYDIAQDIEKRMVVPRKALTAGDERIANRLQAEANKIRAHDFPNRPTLTRLEQQKRELDKFIDFDGTEPPPIQEGLRDLRDYLNANIEQSAWSAAQGAGSDAAERFIRAKELYGNMASVAAPGLKQQARELSNRMISPSDHGVGGISAILAQQGGDSPVEAGVKGAAMALANKVFREYGNQTAAYAMNEASASNWLRAMVEASPEVLGRYGQQLADAAARGPGALELQDYMLAQVDPEYAEVRRRALMQATGQNPSP